MCMGKRVRKEIKHMTTRKRVYIQVYDQTFHRWSNYVSKPTYEEAKEVLRELQKECPKAKLRIRDNNLITHTK